MLTVNKKVFTESFIPVTESGCWIWLRSYYSTHPRLGAYGYYKGEPAHRYSYKQYKGPIPLGYHICHTCDIRECVNPDHLVLGSPYDNVRDMIKKNRHIIPSVKQDQNPIWTR